MAQYQKIDDVCDDPPSSTKAAFYSKEEHLEIDLYQRDSDLRHRQLTCAKNPGHENFIPIQELSMDDLPDAIRHQEIYDYVKAFSKLVVRVKTRCTSHSRPKDDPFQVFAGRGVCRSASGCVARDVDIANIKEYPCTDENCLQGCEHNVYGFVDIQTNRHVVFDADEAKETEVEFFYDNPNRMSVAVMQGFDVKRDPKDEECILVRCVTHDIDFINKINRLVEAARLAGSEIPKSLREQNLTDFAIVISHPHGSVKTFSIGGLVSYKKVPDKAGFLKRFLRQVAGKQKLKLRVTTYMSPTCRGCTGAPVVTGHDDGWGWWSLTHHTSDHNTGISMAFCTPP